MIEEPVNVVKREEREVRMEIIPPPTVPPPIIPIEVVADRDVLGARRLGGRGGKGGRVRKRFEGRNAVVFVSGA